MAVSAMPATTIARPAPRKSLRRIPSTSGVKELSQSVFALDFADRQPAHARQRPAAVGNRDRDHDLVSARRVVDLHLHAVEMAAHKGRVLVAERNVQRRSRTTALFRGWNQ